MCVDCRIKTIVSLRLGVPWKGNVWSQLKEKLEQQAYRCAYSGVPIMPGVNASLDHKVPQSKGGTHEVENLHWVEINVNKMKGSLMPEQFIILCRTIADRAAGMVLP